MKRYLLIGFMILIVIGVEAQREAVSKPGPVSIIKEIVPPLLKIVEGSMAFEDENGNNIIDADENCKIKMIVKNSGEGVGKNLTYSLSATGTINGIAFKTNQAIPSIKAGKSQTISIPVTSYSNTENGAVSFTVKINEPNGFESEEAFLKVQTRAFVAPMLQIIKFSVNPISTHEKNAFELKVFLQNTGNTSAENVSVKIFYPEKVMLLNGSKDIFKNPIIAAGEEVEMVYEFIVNEDFTEDILPFEFAIAEKSKESSEKQTINVRLK